ncbi:hypothetical protein B0H14DRAFT_3569105 [Mycena olivaceomarginata]|nr:hypothetical protein B0H14DRAFT_3569105 [Mycena olivaceomarginata]
MLSADGTSNLGNEVKPKPKRCLVVWHPGSLPQPPLASYPLKDDGGDESDATTPTTPKRHPHLVAGLPPSAPTTPSTAQELFPSPPPFAHVVGSESAAALPCRAVRAARDNAHGNVIQVFFLHFVDLSESAVQTAPWRQLARHITAENTLPKDAANQIPVWIQHWTQIQNIEDVRGGGCRGNKAVIQRSITKVVGRPTKPTIGP